MLNGKMTVRDYVIEIHTDLKNLKEQFKDHKRNHKWLVVLLFIIPGGVYYTIKLFGG